MYLAQMYAKKNKTNTNRPRQHKVKILESHHTTHK